MVWPCGVVHRALRPGSAPMPRAYVAECRLAAPPERVWAVLVDLGAYPRWNPFTLQVRSSLAVGDPVDMVVWMRGRGTVRQREWLEVCEAPSRLVWALRIPVPWLLWARREQRLLPDGEGTRYVTVDEIGGLLGPVVHLLLGRSIAWGFTAMAAALAREVARRDGPGGSP